MFDLGWSEMLIIAVVAIIVVGPKDLPKMLRSLGKFVGQAKRMANDFTGQFQDALRDSDLEDLKKDLQDITDIDPLSDVENSINKDLSDLDRELNETVSDLDKADDADNAAHEAFKSIVPPTDEAANENEVGVERLDEPEESDLSLDDEPEALKAAAGDEKGA